MPESEDKNVVEKASEVSLSSKAPIQCIQSAKNSDSLKQPPSLVFTHGAGGTLKTESIAKFANGFAEHEPIICFQGSMNLKSRVNMFEVVCKDQDFFRCLGGRSMGARAAIMASTSETTHLVLVSYPLHTTKETRDEILLNLPKDVKVMFISGDHDNMCDIERLEEVRKKMKAKSWLCVVRGADHGMSMKPKTATEAMVKHTGWIAADWLQHSEEMATHTTISWNAEAGNPVSETIADVEELNPKTAAIPKRKRPHGKSSMETSHTGEAPKRKRRK